MSRRGKSGETSRSLARIPSRLGGASMASRYTLSEKPHKPPRSQRFTRYTRLGPRHMKPTQTEFRIRTSVADLMMKELEAFDRCIYYQRVYIFARNIVLTVTVESSVESILDRYMHSRTTISEGKSEPSMLSEYPVEEECTAEEEFFEAATEGEEISEGRGSRKMEMKPTREGRLLELTKDDFKAVKKEKRVQELDFFDQFQLKIEEMVKLCDADQLSDDRFTGMLLCMGNTHTLLVLEGTEDTLANFCQELVSISKDYFDVMRVFMVEDRIEEAYFEEFIYRRGPSMNITEKFPPPTANDPQLMAPQHWMIREKLKLICKTLSCELWPPVEPAAADATPQPTIVIIEEEKKPPKKKRVVKPKRKKSPKSKKDITTEAEQAHETGATTQTVTEETSQHSVGNASMTSLKRTASVTSQHQDTMEEPTTTEQVVGASAVGEITVPPVTSAEETAKSDDGIIKKESSTVKLQPVAVVLGEDQASAEEKEDVEEKTLKPLELYNEEVLAPSIYNRLLPEVQRMELVLTSKRFYLDVIDFVRFAHQVPMQPDEDALIWPTSYNYLPLNVFQRLPFDVNLTFGSYDAKEEEEESSSSDEEKAGDDTKDEKKA